MMINFIGLKIMNSQFIEIMRVGEIGQKNAREKSGRKLKELNNIPSLNYPSILLSLYLISYFLLLTSYFLLLTSNLYFLTFSYQSFRILATTSFAPRPTESPTTKTIVYVKPWKNVAIRPLAICNCSTAAKKVTKIITQRVNLATGFAAS